MLSMKREVVLCTWGGEEDHVRKYQEIKRWPATDDIPEYFTTSNTYLITLRVSYWLNS